MQIEKTELDSLLAAIVESSDDAIISKDLNGIVTSWNKGAEQIFGYTAAEAIGRPIAMIAAPERGDEMPRILERIRRGEQVDHFETIRLAKGGRRVNISLTVSPVRDGAGRIVGASKIARDITEKKLAEEALAKQAARLVRANADLQQFAYVTSHDLQEPLRTISACTEMFLAKSGEKLNQEERQLLGYVSEAAQRLSTMVVDLLTYARTLDDDLPLGPVKVREVVEWAVNNLHLSIQSSDATISYDPLSLPTVRGSKVALLQLFQNLISNALKYRCAAAPVVHIAATRRANDWLFSVKDNGIGIAPAYHKRIFNLFQRLHSSQEYPGTGIGLALCRRIAQAHGGDIWVESAEGAGATFFFNIPAGEGM
jgi:PAS domain S-box-containing protein